MFASEEWNAKISWGFDEGLVSIDGDWLEVFLNIKNRICMNIEHVNEE